MICQVWDVTVPIITPHVRNGNHKWTCNSTKQRKQMHKYIRGDLFVAILTITNRKEITNINESK